MIFIDNADEEKVVGRLAEIIALEYGCCPTTATQICNAAALHDVGKQKIPDSILNKPGKLTTREFKIMKTHTYLGAEMLKGIQGELGIMARACSMYHHEWFNGGGYWGRRTNDLPFYVSFVAISDVFIALISERAYKPGWPLKNAVAHIKKLAGTQFNPELVKVFLSLVQNDSRVSVLIN